MRKLRSVLLYVMCVFCTLKPSVLCAEDCTESQINLSGSCIDSKFTVTTKSLNSNERTFKFVLSASGTFYVDWGDGTVDTITRNTTTPEVYTHTFSTGGTKVIKFAGLADGYNNVTYADKDPSGAAIRFGASTGSNSTKTGGTPTLIKELGGSIGSVFPSLGDNADQNPIFFELCVGCTNLTQVSSTLFSGVTKAKKSLFRSVFDKCNNLATVPDYLFAGVIGSAESMFRSAFYECYALSDIPGHLFDGIDGPAKSMFQYTFYKTNSSNLSNKYIPTTLFAGLHNQTATDLFTSTFQNSSLLESCPSGTVLYSGYPQSFYNSWYGKVSCESTQVLSCEGAKYKSGNDCLDCPIGYDYDTTEGKTSINECAMHCNAGTWTGEYEQLDYLESSGTQYIDTGHVVNTSNLSADFEISSGVNVSGNIGHFGGNQDALNGHAVNFKDSVFGLWVAFAKNGNSTGSKTKIGGPFDAGVRKLVHYAFNGNQRTLSVDGTSKTENFQGSIISQNTYRLFSNGCVGGCNDKMLEGRMHWFKLYEDGILIYDFIPVRRTTDNVIGMYDRIHGQLFTNSGTGVFTAGPVIATITGNSCENVGYGYYSADSVTNYGSISQRGECGPDEITDTETSTSVNDCHNAMNSIVCAAGTYLQANASACSSCLAGNWCPGGVLEKDVVDTGIYNCATEIGSGWTSEANASAQTNCYYLITLDKNGFSGVLEAYSGIGCSVASTVEGTTNAQLKLFYNTRCTMPALNLTQTGFAPSTGWSTSNTITGDVVTTIPATTTTPSITTYYARKTCEANYYKSAATTCSACGVNSTTSAGNAVTTCTCDTGYSADGTIGGSSYSTTGCMSVASSVTHLHVEDKLYSLLSQRRTTPSICVDVANTVYYVSLVPAEIEDALAVEYNNMTYSGCDITNDYCITDGKLYWADPNVYLESSTTQYINTGIVPDLDTAIEIEMADISSLTYGLFGVKTGTLATTDEGFGISLTNGNFGFFRNGTSVSAIPKDNNYHVYYLSNTAASIDGVSYNFSPASSPISVQRPMYMFGFNHNGAAYDKAIKIKYLKIWSGNTLLRHFVPVPTGLVIGNYTVPENGMFDIVTQTFYANPGVGSFQYGKVE